MSSVNYVFNNVFDEFEESNYGIANNEDQINNVIENSYSYGLHYFIFDNSLIEELFLESNRYAINCLKRCITVRWILIYLRKTQLKLYTTMIYIIPSQNI